MSLYLRNAFSLSQFHYFICKLLRLRRDLVRIEATKHFGNLALGSEAYFLFDVHPTRAYESWVESVQVICGHEDEPFFRWRHAIQRVQKTTEGHLKKMTPAS